MLQMPVLVRNGNVFPNAFSISLLIVMQKASLWVGYMNAYEFLGGKVNYPLKDSSESIKNDRKAYV
ncbi:hypothetical protein BHC46_06305 [Snodgrassella alvi]|uniref:Uncharacterized protein n=1 Tax=Snodgrassella alvi TaxID=1196083 RepID=A0A2N9XHT1_9NEIS|nr:hypothetical protein BHC46_06305 [Snodgrassella alvi]